MKLQKLLLTFCLLLLGFTFLKSQDSIRLFPRLEQQYRVDRQLQSNLYYNPATMSDYSSLSFTDFGIGYITDKKNSYRPQDGSGENGLNIRVNSYKKQTKNRNIWGTASYQNKKITNIRWNENLDYDRIAPYTIADSAGGDTQLERYQFSGGLSQKIERWTFGMDASYHAQLGSRDRDPRQKSTTSDLTLKLGVNYRFYKNMEIGIFGDLNKYTQNTSVSFVSDLGQALMYQMTGLGFSNYFFNGGSPAAIYEELGYKIGGQLHNSSQQHPFYITGYLSKAKNKKSISPTNRYFDLSDLDKTNYTIEAGQFFKLDQHQFGLILNHKTQKKIGFDYGYTNNTDMITQLYKRKTYKKSDQILTLKSLYQYSTDNFTLGATPNFTYSKTSEQRLYPFSGQKFENYKIGLELFYKQALASNQTLSLKSSYTTSKNRSATNALSTELNPNITSWITADFDYLTASYNQFGASLRYDIQLQKLPVLYIQADWQQTQLLHNTNNFTQLIVGLTF